MTYFYWDIVKYDECHELGIGIVVTPSCTILIVEGLFFDCPVPISPIVSSEEKTCHVESTRDRLQFDTLVAIICAIENLVDEKLLILDILCFL